MAGVDHRIRKVHMYQDNTSRTFANNAPGRVADTLCCHNSQAALVTTRYPSQVTCNRCKQILREQRNAPHRPVHVSIPSGFGESMRKAVADAQEKIRQHFQDFHIDLGASTDEIEDEIAHSNHLADVLRLALSHLGDREHIVLTPGISNFSVGDAIRGALALHDGRRHALSDPVDR